MTRAREPGRRAGFTTVELMAVIAIIGVTMALALPRLSKNRGSTGARDFADASLRALSKARFRAVSERRTYRVRSALTGGRWELITEWTTDPVPAAFPGGTWTEEGARVRAPTDVAIWNIVTIPADPSAGAPSALGHELWFNRDFTVRLIDGGTNTNARIYIGAQPTPGVSPYNGPKFQIQVVGTGAVRKWDRW